MARLSAFTYAIACTNRAEAYFPSKIREGLFLRIEHDDETYGIGECAPLAAIHRENLADAKKLVLAIRPDELEEIFCLPDVPTDALDSFFARYPRLVSNLLSMAHFHRHFMRVRQPSAYDRAIKLAALIEVSDANLAIALAQAYVAQGFCHLKIKVGGLPIEEEVKKIKTIAAIAEGNVKIRLDANLRLSFDDAVILLKALKRAPIEYFEDPLSDPHRLSDLREECGVALAVDESVNTVEDLDWLSDARVDHVIIKPGRLSSIYSASKLVKRALGLGITPIFSHCFESEFSSALFAILVDTLDLGDHAHGIVVDGIFRHGVFAQPLRSFRGQLSMDRAKALITTRFLEVPANFSQFL